jgi:Protein of unknown function (DUF1524)
MQAAKEVMEGAIKTAKQLREKAGSVITRSDKEFKEAFAKARASKNDLARYYLRALELAKRNEEKPGSKAEPELGGILEDTEALNLEHILPQSDSDGWAMSPETMQQYRKRLGNLALLDTGSNAKLGNKSFVEKRQIYKDSPILLTKAIYQYSLWGPEQIEERQEQLAQLAVKVWTQ